MLARAKQNVLLTIKLFDETYPQHHRHLLRLANDVLAAESIEKVNECVRAFLTANQTLIVIRHTWNEIFKQVCRNEDQNVISNSIATTSSLNSFATLPREMVDHISSFLDREDMGALASSSRLFAESIRRYRTMPGIKLQDFNPCLYLKPQRQYVNDSIGSGVDSAAVAVLSPTEFVMTGRTISYAAIVSSDHIPGINSICNDIFTISCDASGHCKASGLIAGHSDSINALLALSENEFVSVSDDQEVRVWRRNAESKFDNVQILQDHHSEVKKLMVLSENEFASASDDGEIIIWRRQDQGAAFASIQTITHHAAQNPHDDIKGLLYLPSGLLMTASNDATLKFWIRNEAGNFVCEQTLQSDAGVITSMAYCENNVIVCGFDNGNIRTLKLDEQSGEYAFNAMLCSEQSEIRVLKPLPDGCLMYVANEGNLGIFKCCADGTFIRMMRDTSVSSGIRDVAMLPDKRLLCASKSEGLYILSFPRLTKRIAKLKHSPFEKAQEILHTYLNSPLSIMRPFSIFFNWGYASQIQTILQDATSYAEIKERVQALHMIDDSLRRLVDDSDNIIPLPGDLSPLPVVSAASSR